MGQAIIGFRGSKCPHCRLSMIGHTYTAFEDMEMQCPQCKGWTSFNMKERRWIKQHWDLHAPDEGCIGHDSTAWKKATQEVEEAS